MEFLAAESLRISLKLNTLRNGSSWGFSVVALWVVTCEYLRLGLHVDNHSKIIPKPLTRIC